MPFLLKKIFYFNPNFIEGPRLTRILLAYSFLLSKKYTGSCEWETSCGPSSWGLAEEIHKHSGEMVFSIWCLFKHPGWQYNGNKEKGNCCSAHLKRARVYVDDALTNDGRWSKELGYLLPHFSENCLPCGRHRWDRPKLNCGETDLLRWHGHSWTFIWGKLSRTCFPSLNIYRIISRWII